MRFKYIDLKYLNEISDGKKDLMMEMVQIFNSEVPGYIRSMNQYYESGNWEALGKLSHKAKASASIMGMKQLASDLKDLELLAQEQKDTRLYPALLKSIEDQFLAAMEELKLFKQTL
jgi:HPt (histidine-containing phosphotransfer) domain-containing protein